MSELKIHTNNHWRQFKYYYEVPENILKNQFDHLDEENSFDGFIYYKDRWYHTSDFMRINKNSLFPNNWQGYCSDSYFSGILIEISEDGESYKIATYTS